MRSHFNDNKNVKKVKKIAPFHKASRKKKIHLPYLSADIFHMYRTENRLNPKARELEYNENSHQV